MEPRKITASHDYDGSDLGDFVSNLASICSMIPCGLCIPSVGQLTAIFLQNVRYIFIWCERIRTVSVCLQVLLYPVQYGPYRYEPETPSFIVFCFIICSGCNLECAIVRSCSLAIFSVHIFRVSNGNNNRHFKHWHILKVWHVNSKYKISMLKLYRKFSYSNYKTVARCAQTAIAFDEGFNWNSLDRCKPIN